MAAGIQHMRRAFQAQVGQDEMGTQQGPQPLHFSPTAIHLVAGIGAAPARPPRPVREPRGQVSGNEGAVCGAARRRTSPGGSGAWPQAVGSRDFCSKEAAVGPACGHAGPAWHCIPGAGAEKAHSVLGDAVCLRRAAPGTDVVDRTVSRGVKGMGETRLSEAGRAE